MKLSDVVVLGVRQLSLWCYSTVISPPPAVSHYLLKCPCRMFDACKVAHACTSLIHNGRRWKTSETKSSKARQGMHLQYCKE
eukprot:2536682-Amphidinium_carterae.3